MNAPPVQIPCTGGVNLLHDPRNIRDDQCIRSKNLYPIRPGQFAKRPAAAFHETTTLTNFVVHSVVFPPQAAEYPYLAAGMLTTSAYGMFTTGVATVQHASTNGYGHQLAVVPYNDQLLVFTGYPFNQNYEVAPSGAITPKNFDGVGNEQLSPKVACTYQRRFVYGNFAERKDAILFSDVDEPWVVGDTAMAANGRWVLVGDGSGDEIVAMQEVALQAGGSPLQTALLVLMKRSCHLFVGQPNETDDSTDMFENLQATRLNISAGCVSPSTLSNTPFGTLWLGEDDVWLLPYGGLPTRVGTNLQPLLKAQPAAGHYKIHGMFHDGFYRLTLFDPEQETREEDAPQGHYWLDLRLSAPQSAEQAQWWGPMRYFEQVDTADTYPRGTLRSDASYGPWGLFKDARLGPNAPLITFGVTAYLAGFGGGTIVLNNLLVLDADAPRDTVGRYTYRYAWQASSSYEVFNYFIAPDDVVYVVTTAGTSGFFEPTWSGASVVDGTVTWTRSTQGSEGPMTDGFIWAELLTKEYDLGEPYVQKLFLHAEIDALVEGPTRLLLEVICDGGRETTTIEEGMVPAGSSLGGQLSLTLSRQFNRERLAPSAGARPLGNTIQLRFSDVGGYVLDSTNNVIRMYLEGAGGVAVEVTVPTGTYDTYEDLLDAVVAAINTAEGIVGTYTVTRYGPIAGIAGTSGQWCFLPTTSVHGKLTSLLGFGVDGSTAVTLYSQALTPYSKSPTNKITFAAPTIHLRAHRRRPT